MSKSDLARLVDGAYAAALDDGLWSSWATDVIGSLGGSGGSIGVADAGDGSIYKMEAFGWERVERDYREYWFQYDPKILLVSRVRRPAVLLALDHVDRVNPQIKAYMAWERGDGNSDHPLLAAVPLSETLRSCLTILRQTGEAPPSAKQVNILRSLLPHISRAMQLAFTYARLLDNAFWEGLTTPSDPSALLLNEQGYILRASVAAERILRSADGITASGRRLHCREPIADSELAAAIGNAIKVEGLSGSVRIPRISGKQPFIAIVYPLAWARRSIAPAEAAALVRLIDPTRFQPGQRSIYQSAFKLSARETDLALLLSENHSTESAAEVMQIALPTARIHLRRLLAKTGTTRQSELVRMLSRFL